MINVKVVLTQKKKVTVSLSREEIDDILTKAVAAKIGMSEDEISKHEVGIEFGCYVSEVAVTFIREEYSYSDKL